VASGLCIYIIATTLWGVCERKFLPKHKPVGAVADAAKTASRTGSNGGGAFRGKKNKGKK
jgi:hypothetical protein